MNRELFRGMIAAGVVSSVVSYVVTLFTPTLQDIVKINILGRPGEKTADVTICDPASSLRLMSLADKHDYTKDDVAPLKAVSAYVRNGSEPLKNFEADFFTTGPVIPDAPEMRIGISSEVALKNFSVRHKGNMYTISMPLLNPGEMISLFGWTVDNGSDPILDIRADGLLSTTSYKIDCSPRWYDWPVVSWFVRTDHVNVYVPAKRYVGAR